jgi:hypothetical protein
MLLIFPYFQLKKLNFLPLFVSAQATFLPLLFLYKRKNIPHHGVVCEGKTRAQEQKRSLCAFYILSKKGIIVGTLLCQNKHIFSKAI